ncbi:MAG: hypothetical protein JSU01_07090 [Bacteroidetes bacterium]|nr:hypothetical protein [Bacteroidota bacterium]
MKKHLNINWKALLVIAMYLFFHITSSFVAPRPVISGQHHIVLKQENARFVRLPKFAKTAISENPRSINRLIQKAAKLFIILLLFATAATAVYYLISPKSVFTSNQSYLRYCVIRI